MSLNKQKNDFPLFSKRNVIYLDNGATTQKPKQVIEAIVNYYQTTNSNIHRGVYRLSQESTEAYENARSVVQRHLSARASQEIIFTKGTTEAINLVASAFGKKFLSKNDQVLITEMEHHSNILPWQSICQEVGAKLKVAPIDPQGRLDLEQLFALLNSKTKILSLTHVSNTLGTINPIKEIIHEAHKHNIVVLVDGAQAIAHMQVDVQNLDVDFYVFSAHKVYGPTGIGVLYGKEEILKQLPNYQTGGGTIKTVTFETTEYADLPFRFEAGTPHIAGAVGLAAALDYLNFIGLEKIRVYENSLLEYATSQLSKISMLHLLGPTNERAGILSFVVDKLHPHDIGVILDQQGIAVRTGHHCTQPLINKLNIPGTVRVSFGLYNTKAEITVLTEAVRQAISMLS